MMTVGNIVRFNRGDDHGIILAVRKDGSRAKVYRYGRDGEDWYPVEWFEVVTAGDETCYKCGGSGLYYFGGMVLNGVYQGKTGKCFGCEGSGQQSDADRKRCHYYWHRKHEEGDDIETPLERSPEPEVKPHPVKDSPMAVKIAKARVRRAFPHKQDSTGHEPEDRSDLIDCGDCGALHRTDVKCPW